VAWGIGVQKNRESNVLRGLLGEGIIGIPNDMEEAVAIENENVFPICLPITRCIVRR
jgi:hypothetical protein